MCCHHSLHNDNADRGVAASSLIFFNSHLEHSTKARPGISISVLHTPTMSSEEEVKSKVESLSDDKPSVSV